MQKRILSGKIFKRGFTVVELLVVVVIIGILTAITVVSYSGIKERVIIASLQSDLTVVSKQINQFQLNDSKNKYPGSILDCPSPAAANLCLKASAGNSLVYSVNNAVSPKSYALGAYNTETKLSYRLTNDTIPIACPLGFVIVPGSATYNQKAFCIMKYEARNNGSNVPTSESSFAATLPWTNVSQLSAIAYSATTCDGCHLMTEAEYLTLAQNIASVPANWTQNVVGGTNNSLFAGHDDNAPATGPLIATSNDSDGWYGETNQGGVQRRTFVLTNGETIWDIPGNVWEWTSGQATTGIPGNSSDASYTWHEWKDINVQATYSNLPNPNPAFGTPAASTWTWVNRVGGLLSNANDTSLQGILRGGKYNDNGGAGLWFMQFNGVSVSQADIGFRVAK